MDIETRETGNGANTAFEFNHFSCSPDDPRSSFGSQSR
jgi:hypothetical protein